MNAALECGICWQVYDPAVGDDVAQVPAGTPFEALPDEWRCPNCDAPKHKFMILGTASAFEANNDAVRRVVDSYRRAAAELSGLPVYNPQLIVEAVGFREHGELMVGVIVTPWFMNLTAIPQENPDASWHIGQATRLVFASGEYEFLISELASVGLIASCSLFSPMNDFTDHEAARTAAQAASDALFEPDTGVAASPVSASIANAPPALTRRNLLGVPR